jgi:hypothetical protein
MVIVFLLVEILCALFIALYIPRLAYTRSDPSEQMRVIIKNWYAHIEDVPFEIREYTHPLLEKYLPDYRFYIPYFFPYHSDRYSCSGNYISTLGIVTKEGKLFLFDNSRKKGTSEDLIKDFLKKADLQVSAFPSQEEFRELARMTIILCSLKGLNGWGVLKADTHGLPAVRDVKPEDFQVESGQEEITLSYMVDNDRERLEFSLTFSSKGKIIKGRLFNSAKGGILLMFPNQWQ